MAYASPQCPLHHVLTRLSRGQPAAPRRSPLHPYRPQTLRLPGRKGHPIPRTPTLTEACPDRPVSQLITWWRPFSEQLACLPRPASRRRGGDASIFHDSDLGEALSAEAQPRPTGGARPCLCVARSQVPWRSNPSEMGHGRKRRDRRNRRDRPMSPRLLKGAQCASAQSLPQPMSTLSGTLILSTPSISSLTRDSTA